MYCLLFLGAAAYGHTEMPAHHAGVYTHSCDTSYCRAAQVYHTPQASVQSILNRPSGLGYSVKYNHGLEPTPASTWSAGSSSYNYGAVASMK